MSDDDLFLLRCVLKSGEYDGVDIMRAWLALDELMAVRKRSAALSSGELPEPAVMCDCGGNYYTAEQVRQLLAAERERCACIAEETVVAEYEGVDCYGDKAAEAIRRGSV